MEYMIENIRAPIAYIEITKNPPTIDRRGKVYSSKFKIIDRILLKSSNPKIYRVYKSKIVNPKHANKQSIMIFPGIKKVLEFTKLFIFSSIGTLSGPDEIFSELYCFLSYILDSKNFKILVFQ
jgi:hypothetical protein